MKTELINFDDLFNNVLSTLSSISSFLDNNPMNINCIIFILVTITLLGIVLFTASTSANINNLLDTDADFKRRKNDNRIPLDLAYVTNGLSSPFLIDRNDSTGIRMSTLFLNRASLTERGGISGFPTNPRHAVYNMQGELLVNAPLASFTAVNAFRGVQTRGIPIQTEVHNADPNTIIILKVSRNV